MALVKKVNLQVPQGSTYVHTFFYKDSNDNAIDLTGFEARMQIRETVDDDTVAWEGTSQTGELVIDAANGKLILTVPATDTTSFDFRNAVYDIEIEDGSGVVTRLVQGDVKVSPEVTR